MKDKKTIQLITVCTIILTGLILIQLTLIKNTYTLTKKNYIDELKKSSKDIIKSSALKKADYSLYEFLIKSSKEYGTNKNVNKEIFIQKFKLQIDSLQKVNILTFKKAFKEDSLLSYHLRSHIIKLAFKNYNGVIDTILTKNDSSLVYLNNHFQNKKEFININYTYQNHDEDLKNDTITSYLTFYVESSTDLNTYRLKREVLKRMSSILILAILLITSIVILLFWILRSLIKQKKIAEIKSDLANNIAHELRTPIASLKLIVKTLKNKNILSDEAKLNETLDSLSRQNQRLQNTIEKILESSFKTNENSNLQTINPNDFLNEFSKDFKSESHQLVTKLNLPNNANVKTDKHQIERIIQNLLENAIKYSPKQNQIQLSSTIKKNYWEISVTDFGIGISSNEKNKIFDKFYRVSQGNQHNTKGLGLGLFLSKNLAQKLGGTLSVKSKVNEGSTFTLKIPII